MSYLIESSLNRGETVPCIEELILQMRRFGVDRLAMVQRRTAEVAPALYILLKGGEAVRKLGPFLRQHAATLPLKDASERLAITTDMSFKWIYRWMESTGNQWCWSDLRFTDAGLETQVIFVAITGPSLTKKLCRQLSARGLYCKLT